MTVSRVLNREQVVRPETREAVLQAVRALGYAPNPAARQLAGGSVSAVGLLVGGTDDASLGALLTGALGACRRAGRHLVVERGGGRSEEDDAIRRLVAQPLEGIILATSDDDRARPDALEASGTLFVELGPGIRPALRVRIDDAAAAGDLARHLLGLGHSRIGFLAGGPSRLAADLRRRGVRAAVAAAAAAEVVEVEPADPSYRAASAAAERLLDGHPHLTALFGASPESGLAAMEVARRRGRAPPHGLSVVGFGGGPLTAAIAPELTTVEEPWEVLGGAAVELLLDEQNARRSGQQGLGERVVDHVVSIRTSAAPPPN